jgi:WD40 repeat protein
MSRNNSRGLIVVVAISAGVALAHVYSLSQKKVNDGNLRFELQGHKYEITFLAFSPTENLLASAAYGEERTLLWDCKTGKLKHTLKHPHGVSSLAFSADGRTLASRGKDVRLWDVYSGKLKRILSGPPGYYLVSSPDARILAGFGGELPEGEFVLWDAGTNRLLRSFRGHHDQITSVAFSADNHIVASAAYGNDKAVILRDVASAKTIRRFQAKSESGISRIQFLSHDTKLGCISVDSSYQEWDTKTGRSKYLPSDFYASNLSVTPNGRMYASGVMMGGGKGLVEFRDAQTGRELGELYTPTFSSLALSADGQLLAVGRYFAPQIIEVWRINTHSADKPVSSENPTFEPS